MADPFLFLSFLAKNMRIYSAALLLALCSSISAQDIRRGSYQRVMPPIGILGYRLGSLITIEGFRAFGPKTGNQTLTVDSIDGEKLKAPVSIWIEHKEGLPPAQRIVLRGYETGEWIGTPDEVIEANPEKGIRQAAWQFFHSFQIVNIVSPKELYDDSPNKPTL